MKALGWGCGIIALLVFAMLLAIVALSVPPARTVVMGQLTPASPPLAVQLEGAAASPMMEQLQTLRVETVSNNMLNDDDTQVVLLGLMVSVVGIVLLGLALMAVALPVSVVVRAFRSGTRERRDRASNESETRLMQDLHQGFARLEERVEALETILIEQSRAASRAQEKAGR